jgi:hypothetical protein
MYSACIFCNRPLGDNTVLEEFPAGRRLAFDAAKGRLWVVCRRCERWNLSPIEERWEAIEAAERLFRDTRMRVSTENIGLARHPEGLELVRIGRPLRPEFAAWRYGDQFGRRRRRAIVTGVGAAAAFGVITTAGAATGAMAGAAYAVAGHLFGMWRARTLVRIPTSQGTLAVRAFHLQGTRMGRTPGRELSLVVGLLGTKQDQFTFTGSEDEWLAGVIVPRLNARAGRKRVVQEAVRDLERVGGPQAYVAQLVTNVPLRFRTLFAGDGAEAHLIKLPAPARLALEMALHEEQERRALEGELRALELAWRAAEQVAAIADDLLLPDSVRTRLDAGAG